jgi:hypothetical protein
MSFKKVINNQFYFKGVIYGDTGTGKTTFAEKIAIALADKTKKIYVLDTEGGIEFFAKTFEENGIECFVQNEKIKSVDMFNKNLQIAINEKPDVIIIDSISHIGELYQQEYVSSKDPRNSILNWGLAKKAWNNAVANLLKEANCHIIICGRETSGMLIEVKDGKKEISYSNPTKVKSGFDLDYELNILIQMSTGQLEDKQVRFATILKDRSNKIDGEKFINPTFDNIKPHFAGLGAKKSVQENTLKQETQLNSTENIKLNFEKYKELLLDATNLTDLKNIYSDIFKNKDKFLEVEFNELEKIKDNLKTELTNYGSN